MGNHESHNANQGNHGHHGNYQNHHSNTGNAQQQPVYLPGRPTPTYIRSITI